MSPLEVIGAAYMRSGRPERAWAVADSLLLLDSLNAAGYLMKTMVALQRGDTLSARTFFPHYVSNGAGRPEYQSILSTYSFLLE